jgi:CheY-like chemotaxis protein
MPGRTNILLIDHDPDHRQFFRDSLDHLSIEHDLFISKNCIDLVHLFQNDRAFDLIIMDINIPEENGKDCLRKLKSDERSKKIPVVIFTLSQNKKDVDDAFETGAHYYVIKPYSKINYKATVGKIFANDWTITPPLPAKENFVIDLSFH